MNQVKSNLTGFVGILIFLTILAGCAGQGPAKPDQAGHQIEPYLVDELGIHLIAMRRTAGGNMLDFRFKVIEPEKAMPLFREDLHPYIVDQSTGISLKVTDTTKVGPMRPTSRDPREGKVYFMFFRNPNRYLQAGQEVTIVVGDHKIENVLLQ